MLSARWTCKGYLSFGKFNSILYRGRWCRLISFLTMTSNPLPGWSSMRIYAPYKSIKMWRCVSSLRSWASRVQHKLQLFPLTFAFTAWSCSKWKRLSEMRLMSHNLVSDLAEHGGDPLDFTLLINIPNQQENWIGTRIIGICELGKSFTLADDAELLDGQFGEITIEKHHLLIMNSRSLRMGYFTCITVPLGSFPC